jgi:hypothetical protein
VGRQILPEAGARGAFSTIITGLIPQFLVVLACHAPSSWFPRNVAKRGALLPGLNPWKWSQIDTLPTILAAAAAVAAAQR